MSELLPCPFCGGESFHQQSEIRDEDDNIQNPAFVQCGDCLGCAFGDDLASAIEAWDLRYQPPAAPNDFWPKIVSLFDPESREHLSAEQIDRIKNAAWQYLLDKNEEKSTRALLVYKLCEKTAAPDIAAPAVSDELLREILITMRHAKTFISSRQKMHPTGIELYEKDIEKLEAALARGNGG